VLRLHDAPEGPTSITGTARLALAIFYIVITPLSGHTQVEVAGPLNTDTRPPGRATQLTTPSDASVNPALAIVPMPLAAFVGHDSQGDASRTLHPCGDTFTHNGFVLLTPVQSVLAARTSVRELSWCTEEWPGPSPRLDAFGPRQGRQPETGRRFIKPGDTVRAVRLDRG